MAIVGKIRSVLSEQDFATEARWSVATLREDGLTD